MTGTTPKDIKLTREEAVSFIEYGAFLFLLFRHGDMAFYQFQAGMLSEPRLSAGSAPTNGRLRFQLVHEFWKASRQNFVQSYQDYIDQMIAAQAGG